MRNKIASSNRTSLRTKTILYKAHKNVIDNLLCLVAALLSTTQWRHQLFNKLINIQINKKEEIAGSNLLLAFSQ